MPEQKHIRDIFEEKARKGDGAYAIAFALLDLSDSQEATARALKRLGLADASTHLGALELLGMQIEKAAEIIGERLDAAGREIAAAVATED